MTNDEIDVMKTSDFTLASSIFCLGHDVLGINKENPRRAIFIFKKTPELQRVVDNFFTNTLSVNPLEFVNAQRELRAQIHTDL